MNLRKWLWLITTKGIGAKKAVNIYDYFDSINMAYENDDIGEYLKIPGITPKLAENLMKNKGLDKFNRMVDYMYEEKIEYVTIDQRDYPENLREAYDYPPLLFYKGKNLFREDTPMISIVGTRNASTYGKEVARDLARQFSNRGINVVSGMALGIDTKAHEGALAGYGDTIAVLGCGVDKVYPLQNKSLYEDIIARGMVVSEYIPGTEPVSYNFPPRNRIISGLSYGTIVVEASERSGSLITARYANEQGREVYAVPGHINYSSCSGSNLLLKDGAKIVLKAEDVIEDLYYVLKRRPFRRMTDILKEREEDKKLLKEDNVLDKLNLKEEEKRVCQCILDGENTSDLISRNLKMEINLVNSILTMLEIKGIVISTGVKLEVNPKCLY